MSWREPGNGSRGWSREKEKVGNFFVRGNGTRLGHLDLIQGSTLTGLGASTRARWSSRVVLLPSLCGRLGRKGRWGLGAYLATGHPRYRRPLKKPPRKRFREKKFKGGFSYAPIVDLRGLRVFVNSLLVSL